MTKKQTDFLEKFNNGLLNSQEDKFLTGAKYKNGNQTLDAHDLSHEQWMELVIMHDHNSLWQEAIDFLRKL